MFIVCNVQDAGQSAGIHCFARYSYSRSLKFQTEAVAWVARLGSPFRFADILLFGKLSARLAPATDLFAFFSPLYLAVRYC